MQVKFKQIVGHGCGLYALSNVMNDNSFVTEKTMEQAKSGNYVHQLNLLLMEHDYKFYIDTVYAMADPTILKLPPAKLELKPQDPQNLFPCLFEVKPLESMVKYHLIAGFGDSDCNLYVIDSLRTEIVKTTWARMIAGEHYEIVTGVFGFSPMNGTGWTMFDKKKVFDNYLNLL